MSGNKEVSVRDIEAMTLYGDKLNDFAASIRENLDEYNRQIRQREELLVSTWSELQRQKDENQELLRELAERMEHEYDDGRLLDQYDEALQIKIELRKKEEEFVKLRKEALKNLEEAKRQTNKFANNLIEQLPNSARSIKEAADTLQEYVNQKVIEK